MKKAYVKPVVEKVTFDYKEQIATSSCFGSVINVATSVDQCGEGTPNYFGWNNAHPGQF